jgi:hypothetical protein
MRGKLFDRSRNNSSGLRREAMEPRHLSYEELEAGLADISVRRASGACSR